jgi:hypothetical protein
MSETKSLPSPSTPPARLLTVRQFTAAIKGTAHEVWSRLLLIDHGTARLTLEGWHALIAKRGQEPAHPSVMKKG